MVIQGAWLRQGSERWGPRFLLADTPGYPDCNPALFAAPDGSVWLFWPTILDHRWEGALLKYAVADADPVAARAGRSGRGPGVLHVTPGSPPTSPPRSIAALGTLTEEREAKYQDDLDECSKRDRGTCSTSDWAGCREFTRSCCPRAAGSCRSTATRSPPRSWRSATIAARSWSASRPMVGFGNIQPSLVRKNDGTLVAFMRDNGPHHRIRDEHVGRRRDDLDAGRGHRLPNPGRGYRGHPPGQRPLGLDLQRYRPGAGTRWPSRCRTTKGRAGNGPATWSGASRARVVPLSVDAPGTRWRDPRDLHPSAGRGKGSTIMYARFNEAWIRQGDAKPLSDDSGQRVAAKPARPGDPMRETTTWTIRAAARIAGQQAYPWLVVGLLWFCGFFNYADRQAVNSVFPLLEKEFSALRRPAWHARLGVHGRLCRHLAVRRLRGRPGLPPDPDPVGLAFWSLICAATGLSQIVRPARVLPGGRGAGRVVLLPGLDVVPGRLPRAAAPVRAPWAFTRRASTWARPAAPSWPAGWPSSFGWRSPFCVLGLTGRGLCAVLGFLPGRTGPRPGGRGQAGRADPIRGTTSSKSGRPRRHDLWEKVAADRRRTAPPSCCCASSSAPISWPRPS